MRLLVVFIALVSATLAQEEIAQRSARAPQGQIKYSDPDGLKVNWRFFSPQNQWRSHLENSQRQQRAEPETGNYQRPSQQVEAASLHQGESEPNSQQYKPYSALPTHIKQLIHQTYEPQRPYVDQSAFLYGANFATPQQYDQQSATAELSHEQQKFQSRRDYADGRLKGRIEYKEDYDQQEQQQESHVQHVPPVDTVPLQPIPKLYLDKNMPSEIQQLLQYQAQIPYDVIANRIIYKPKTLFIPKPLPDDAKGPHYYRSKVYYVKNENYEPEYETSKPVQEDPRHHHH